MGTTAKQTPTYSVGALFMFNEVLFTLRTPYTNPQTFPNLL